MREIRFRELRQKILFFFNGLRPLRGGGGSKSADKKVRKKKENRTLIETLINHLKSSENFPIDSLRSVLFQKSVTKIIRVCQLLSL